MFVSFASLLVYTFGVLLKPLAEEFSWSREAVSAAFGIAAMTVAACSPPLGYLFDRVKPTRIIVPCLIVFGCAFASLALLTPRLWQLYLTFFVLGVVGNGTAQMAYSRAVSSWFERRRGTALAVVMSGGAIGAIVLPPAAEALIETVGWRRACLVLGAMVLVVGIPIVARFIRERPADRGAATVLDGVSIREGVTSRVFWILVVVLFAQSIAQNGALTHMSALLTDRGVPAERCGACVISHGSRELAWTPRDRMAPRSILRAARGLLSVVGGRGRDLSSGWRAVAGRGRGRGCLDRIWHGRRGRCHALHLVALSWACARSPCCMASRGRRTRSPARSAQFSWAAPSMRRDRTRRC